MTGFGNLLRRLLRMQRITKAIVRATPMMQPSTTLAILAL